MDLMNLSKSMVLLGTWLIIGFTFLPSSYFLLRVGLGGQLLIIALAYLIYAREKNIWKALFCGAVIEAALCGAVFYLSIRLQVGSSLLDQISLSRQKPTPEREFDPSMYMGEKKYFKETVYECRLPKLTVGNKSLKKLYLGFCEALQEAKNLAEEMFAIEANQEPVSMIKNEESPGELAIRAMQSSLDSWMAPAEEDPVLTSILNNQNGVYSVLLMLTNYSYSLRNCALLLQIVNAKLKNLYAEAEWFLNMVQRMEMWPVLSEKHPEYLEIINSEYTFCHRLDVVDKYKYIVSFLQGYLLDRLGNRTSSSSATTENDHQADVCSVSLSPATSSAPLIKADRFERELAFGCMLKATPAKKEDKLFIGLVKKEVKRYTEIIKYLRESIITYIKICDIEIPNNHFCTLAIHEKNPKKEAPRELPFFYTISQYNRMYGLGEILDYVYPHAKSIINCQSNKKQLSWMKGCKATDPIKRLEFFQKRFQALGYYVYQRRASTCSPIYLSMFKQLSDKHLLLALTLLHPDLLKFYVTYKDALTEYEELREKHKANLRFDAESAARTCRYLSQDDKISIEFVEREDVKDLQKTEFIPESWECPLPKELFNIPAITRALQEKAESLGCDASMTTNARVIRYPSLYIIIEIVSDESASSSAPLLFSLHTSSDLLSITPSEEEMNEGVKGDSESPFLCSSGRAISSPPDGAECPLNTSDISVRQREKMRWLLKDLLRHEREKTQYSHLFALVINNPMALQKSINILLDPRANYKFHSFLLFIISKFTGKLEEVIEFRNIIIYSLYTSEICHNLVSCFLLNNGDSSSFSLLCELLGKAEAHDLEAEEKVRNCLISFMLAPQMEEKLLLLLSRRSQVRPSSANPYFFLERWSSSFAEHAGVLISAY